MLDYSLDYDMFFLLLKLPTNERVVTIQNNDANPDNIETALKLILEIIKGDPQSSSCLTINYSNSGGHSNNRDDYNEDYGDDSKSYGGGGGGGGGGKGNQLLIFNNMA